MKLMTKMAANAAAQIKQAERDGLLDEIVLGMHDKDPTALFSLLPFGSEYVGYRRGADKDRRLEGVLRGFGGSLGGGFAGGVVGALPGVLLHNPHLAYGGLSAGTGLGTILGTHLATRGLVDED